MSSCQCGVGSVCIHVGQLGLARIAHGARLSVGPSYACPLRQSLKGTGLFSVLKWLRVLSAVLQAAHSQYTAVWWWLCEEAVYMLGTTVAQWERTRLAS